MGLKLTPTQRKTHAAMNAARRGLPIPGMATGWIPGDPPTVTHHDKKIVRMGNALTLADSPALVQARRTYLLLIPQRQGAPVAGPLALSLRFFWTRKIGTRPEWWEEKPDWDNIAKGLTDALVDRGWIEDDKFIVRGEVEKIAVPPLPSARPGVQIQLITLPPYCHEEADPDTYADGLRMHPFESLLPSEGVRHAS